MKSLCDKLRPTSDEFKVSDVIIKTLSRILKLQSTVIKEEGRLSILKRGIDKNVILERNTNIQCIVTDLLTNPFYDKDEVLRFQHAMYHNIMDIEAKAVEKEMTSLNCVASKEIRLLKTLTDNDVFKLCSNYLQERKANEIINIGKDKLCSIKRNRLNRSIIITC